MEQEIQLGKEAAAQVEREMEVVKNPEAEAWLNRIGAQLAKTPQANAYPYYFQLVNEESINAFALPGGPMFVHTGLIKAADNEGQVAGVLAHEMSHVALRHGVSQMGRSAKHGRASWGSREPPRAWRAAPPVVFWGPLSTTEVRSGSARSSANTRAASERDADLNGARMLASAGYNPIEMARFFEKLEAEMGTAAKSKGLEAWFASHPDPGRRVEMVSEDIQFYPAKQYNADTGQFPKIKQLVKAIPPPKMKPAVALQPVQAQPRNGLPQGFADLHTKDFAVAYPQGWQAGQAQAGGGLYLVPQGGATKNQQGGIELIAGAMIDYQPSSGTSQELAAATKGLLESLQKGDPNIKLGGTSRSALAANRECWLVLRRGPLSHRIPSK